MIYLRPTLATSAYLHAIYKVVAIPINPTGYIYYDYSPKEIVTLSDPFPQLPCRSFDYDAASIILGNFKTCILFDGPECEKLPGPVKVRTLKVKGDTSEFKDFVAKSTRCRNTGEIDGHFNPVKLPPFNNKSYVWEVADC